MAFRVGCVPYVNARPLVSFFEELGDEGPVEVVYDVPSKLPALLDSGQADAVLASSYDALSTPGRRYAEGVCIGSFGPAESVRLFSKVPFAEIGSLALDASSLTSNHLAQILLGELHGVRPQVRHAEPELGKMLSESDAAVLIGDRGYLADGTGLHVMDLGEAWSNWTGLPFVWALWIGGEGLTSTLALHLQTAMVWGQSQLDAIATEAAEDAGWPEAGCRNYLKRTMRYDLDDLALSGLERYRDWLIEYGFAAAGPMPEEVEAIDPDLAAFLGSV